MDYRDEAILEPDYDVFAWTDAAEAELFLEEAEAELLGGMAGPE